MTLVPLDLQIQSALIGLAGAVIGALAAIIGQVVTTRLKHHLETADKRKLDEQRQAYLLHLLTHRPPGIKWLKMSTLSRAIGATEEETARLLIAVNARGSTGQNNVWALIKDQPFKDYDDAEGEA